MLREGSFRGDCLFQVGATTGAPKEDIVLGFYEELNKYVLMKESVYVLVEIVEVGDERKRLEIKPLAWK